eukprot:scaffold156855_cov35-Tisochrysis_lutea.AAC.1
MVHAGPLSASGGRKRQRRGQSHSKFGHSGPFGHSLGFVVGRRCCCAVVQAPYPYKRQTYKHGTYKTEGFCVLKH